MVLEAAGDGIETAGALIDSLERLSPEERRGLLDRWRSAAGVATATEIDAERERRRIDHRFDADDIPGPPRWSEHQACHGCGAWPTKENGAIATVTVEKYFCPQCEHLAEPHDLEEHEPPYIGLGLNGKPIPSEKEKARIAAEIRKRDEPRERERRKREELRAREAEAIDEARERYREEGEISILGIRTRPDGRLIR